MCERAEVMMQQQSIELSRTALSVEMEEFNGQFGKQMLMEILKFMYPAGEEDLGAVTLNLVLTKIQPPCGVGLDDALQLLKEYLADALWVF